MIKYRIDYIARKGKICLIEQKTQAQRILHAWQIMQDRELLAKLPEPEQDYICRVGQYQLQLKY